MEVTKEMPHPGRSVNVEPVQALRRAGCSLPRMWGGSEAAHGGRAPRAWPKFMSAKVAADYSDTSTWTVRRNVEPCGRRGRSLVYAIESVEAWMRGAAIEHGQTLATVASGMPTQKERSLARIHDLARTRVDGERRAVLASIPPSVAA